MQFIGGAALGALAASVVLRGRGDLRVTRHLLHGYNKSMNTPSAAVDLARKLVAEHAAHTYQFIDFLVPREKGAMLWAAVDKGFFHCCGTYVGFTANDYPVGVYEVMALNELMDARFGLCCRVTAQQVKNPNDARCQFSIPAKFYNSASFQSSLMQSCF